MTKVDIVKRLEGKKKAYKKRIFILLALILVCEGFILWVLNPNLFPATSEAAEIVGEFFVQLLWPHSPEELELGTYRAYIYYFCTGLTGLTFYPYLEMALPLFLPAWLALTIIQLVVVNIRIRWLQRPVKDTKRREKKPRKNTKPRALWKCGFDKKYSNAVNKRFEELQQRCRTAQIDGADCCVANDYGLWVGNRAAVAGGKHPPDMIYPWDNNTIRIPCKNRTLCFHLTDKGVKVENSGNGEEILKKGVPLIILHENEVGEKIIDMTVTWLGGCV